MFFPFLLHIIKLVTDNKLEKHVQKQLKLCYTIIDSIKSEVLKMEQITNFQELQTAINQGNETVVNKNNANNSNIISMEKYRNISLDDETIKCLLKSEQDIEEGRTRKATDVIKELRAKYGF